MSTCGVLLTEYGLNELGDAIAPYLQEGPIGKFIYCASAVQVGNFIEMVFDPKHTDGSVKERMTISVPVQFVKFIARAEGNSTIGFMQPA